MAGSFDYASSLDRDKQQKFLEHLRSRPKDSRSLPKDSRSAIEQHSKALSNKKRSTTEGEPNHSRTCLEQVSNTSRRGVEGRLQQYQGKINVMIDHTIGDSGTVPFYKAIHLLQQI